MAEENVPAYTDAMSQAGSEEIDPQTKSRIEAFNVVLMNIMHSEQTREEVLNMLKDDGDDDEATNDPFLTIPNAAVSINDMAVTLMAEKQIKVGFDIQLAGSVLVLNDLVELGIATKLWEELPEEDVAMIYEDTLQIVIERGLEDGSIDPIQLQLDAESLMNEDQKRGGDALAQEKGLGAEPSSQAMSEQHAQGRERKAMEEATSKAAKEKQTALQGGVDQKVA